MGQRFWACHNHWVATPISELKPLNCCDLGFLQTLTFIQACWPIHKPGDDHVSIQHCLDLICVWVCVSKKCECVHPLKCCVSVVWVLCECVCVVWVLCECVWVCVSVCVLCVLCECCVSVVWVLCEYVWVCVSVVWVLCECVWVLCECCVSASLHTGNLWAGV